MSLLDMKKVDHIRQQKKITQDKFFKALGIAPQNYQAYLSGTRRMSPEKFDSIAHILGVRVEQILTDSSYDIEIVQVKMTTEEAELVKWLRLEKNRPRYYELLAEIRCSKQDEPQSPVHRI